MGPRVSYFSPFSGGCFRTGGLMSAILRSSSLLPQSPTVPSSGLQGVSSQQTGPKAAFPQS